MGKHNPKLLKRKKHWYLVDDTVPPTEGGTSIYAGTIPVFTSFVDEGKRNCFIEVANLVVTFDELVTVMGSTNPNDGTPMLSLEMMETKYLSKYVNEKKDENDSSYTGIFMAFVPDCILGEFDSEEKAIAEVRAHFKEQVFNILTNDEYLADYTISFEGGPQSAYINQDGFVNILRVKSKTN